MDFDAKLMDAAAEIAKKDFDKLPQNLTVPMARWFYKYYMKAGHKRLGRILVQHAKAMKDTTEQNWTNEKDVKILND